MKHFLKIAFIVAIITLLSPTNASASASSLPAAIRQMLQKAGIPEDAIAVFVQEVNASQPSLAINENKAMNPASVMKLVTTYAGLELLGSSYTWRTEAYTQGNIHDGRLQGDLVIKGYGDPSMNLENFWQLVRQIRQTGLREISGDLVLDYSYYKIAPGNPAAFDGAPYKPYNVLPEALLVNYKTSALHIIPDLQRDQIKIVEDPELQLMDLSNQIQPTRKNCGNWRNQIRTEILENGAENGRPMVRFNGNYSIHCGHNTYYLSLHSSGDYIHQLFKHFWQQSDGDFNGKVRRGTAPAGASPIMTYHSPPLADVIRGINKFSNNVAARQLYLSLGEQQTNGHAALSMDLAHIAIQRWLSAKRLNFSELIIENGSGLSRKARVSAQHLGKLLIDAFHSPVMPEFMSSLAVVGIDGTARNRLKKTGVIGRAHLKTGSLRNVSAIAGYVLDNRNRRHAFVFVINHPKAASARTAMDALIKWIHG
ncbi:MAG: D-alanyl-D-alanine carboxypeptidase/D-alanyl-D-alanine-endopeptidase [Nitrosomonas sp.]|nr:D-alanyl-D-alanine carboxypeptidase/D-alanyl-D-alanine-endopeptidase [Nitrosomonas sp.]